MINDLPTIFEVVTGAAKKELQEKSSASNHSSSKSKSNSKPVQASNLVLSEDYSLCDVPWSDHVKMARGVLERMSLGGLIMLSLPYVIDDALKVLLL